MHLKKSTLRNFNETDISREIQNLELDRPRNRVHDEPAVVTETGKGPGVGGRPRGRVDGLFVVLERLDHAGRARGHRPGAQEAGHEARW